MMARLDEELQRLGGRLAELERVTEAKLAQLRQQGKDLTGDDAARRKAVLVGAQRLIKMQVGGAWEGITELHRFACPTSVPVPNFLQGSSHSVTL